MFRATIAGSLPKPEWLAEPEKLWPSWRLQGEALERGKRDVANSAVESPEQVAATIRAAAQFVDAERISPCTNCGMAPLSRTVAAGKLRALGAGAELARTSI